VPKPLLLPDMIPSFFNVTSVAFLGTKVLSAPTGIRKLIRKLLNPKRQSLYGAFPSSKQLLVSTSLTSRTPPWSNLLFTTSILLDS